jgi:hypothetical protein
MTERVALARGEDCRVGLSASGRRNRGRQQAQKSRRGLLKSSPAFCLACLSYRVASGIAANATEADQGRLGVSYSATL